MNLGGEKKRKKRKFKNKFRRNLKTGLNKNYSAVKTARRNSKKVS